MTLKVRNFQVADGRGMAVQAMADGPFPWIAHQWKRSTAVGAALTDAGAGGWQGSATMVAPVVRTLAGGEKRGKGLAAIEADLI